VRAPDVAPWTVVYDGECALCVRSIEWVRDRDREGRFELVAYQSGGVMDRFPEIPPSDFETSVQLVGPDRRRWEGAAAVEKILELIPRTRPVSRLFRIPLVRPIARVIYRAFARNRDRFGCGDHCTPV
jgi:predicted DCC family thiol-disulfide oxidoreductase YuxK